MDLARRCLLPLFLLAVGTLWAADPSGAGKERKAILAVDEQYAGAFNRGDPAAAAALFSEDAVYETADGAALRGRKEIEDTLRRQFAGSRGTKLSIRIHNLNIAPQGNTATERGSSVLTLPDGTQESSSYIAEFSKRDGQWLVSKVEEKPEAASAEKLRPLAWMIGDWEDTSPNISVRTKNEWSLDKAFIVRRFDVYSAGKRDISGIEYIGWDPDTAQIKSWYFDTAGGFGQAVWRQQGKRWLEDATGTLPDGSIASATHIMTQKTDDAFTWQSVNRRIGDEAQPDIQEITIVRKASVAETASRENL